MSTTPEFNSHWMLFDISTQKWTTHAVELSLVLNCCSGSIVTLRGAQYFFYQLIDYHDPFSKSGPIISRILGNGTIVDLNVTKPPLEEAFHELEDKRGLAVQIAPFLQRFYKNMK